jgi:flagellar biosynthesis/type III secretory pathway chaperone
MNHDWNQIADLLRQELAEYGGLLHAFEQQEHAVLASDPERVLRLNTDIEAQVIVLKDCRNRREDAVAAFAAACGQPRSSTLRSLLPRFPDDVRPLLEALMNEVNVLIHRVRRVSRHNQILLARAVETHQQALRTLRPEAFMETYSAQGRTSLSSTLAKPSLSAAG